ncbi:NAD-dependent deacetylase [Enterococcus sp. DIV0755b]|uniref:NAD-dependent protein deacylase n=1 Tax=Enterococcus sp. DIV0755b TaxID=2774657 RepID=UPI003F25F7AE
MTVINEALEKIQAAKKITFLTGAGVSTPSQIPDYRSLKGVYAGIEQPEYLLSVDCLNHEPQKFYQFVKLLYHPSARPNVIHEKIAALEKTKSVWVVSQNIDGLHNQAGSKNVVNFHGNLYDVYCRKCGQNVSWQDYLVCDTHQDCGGQLRPNIVLYGEGFTDATITLAINAVEQADLIVIAGTSFQVAPFNQLLYYHKPQAEVLAVNQTALAIQEPFTMVQCAAEELFDAIKI